MLSMGLKNGILALLIILILHVLIKNAIIDKKMYIKKLSSTLNNEPEGVHNTTLKTSKHIEELKETFKSPIIEQENSTFNKKECAAALKIDEETMRAADNESDLLKFVYGDEADTQEISKFFIGKDVTMDVKQEIDEVKKCNLRTTYDQSLPLSTTCDPNLQKETSQKNADKTISQNCGLNQNISNMMLLNIYENEDAMNGGPIYGGLSAYDSGNINYEDYKCNK